jgi:hypothetical protein
MLTPVSIAPLVGAQLRDIERAQQNVLEGERIQAALKSEPKRKGDHPCEAPGEEGAADNVDPLSQLAVLTRCQVAGQDRHQESQEYDEGGS